jgi:hypothetical protein
MSIEKSHWISNGDQISLSVPFTKVNREKRTVSGFATLDNLDQTGDVVTAEASLKAFENFRGNIREMHTPLAVGKLVSFKPETYYDAHSKKFYNGVYVDVYVSKGAQDTWEKVLDGTLSGFSIGGKITESDNEVNKADGTAVRFIKQYDLVELSIVDSPANELCNILSISKSKDGQLVFKGMAASISVENIFYCEDSDSVFMSAEKTYTSPITGKPAILIGWVETNDVNKSKEVDKILASFKKSRETLPDTKIAKQANAEGGNEVSENTETTAVEDTVVEKSVDAVEETTAEAVEETTEVVAEEAAAEDASAETVEKAAEEDTDLEKAATLEEQPDFAKMMVDLKGFFSDTLTKAAEVNAAQVSEIRETVESFSKSVNAQITELAEKHSALSAAVTDIKSTIDGVQKRVDAVEHDTAFKKSSDLGGSQEVIRPKSKWNGSFLGSVNELIN